MTLKVLRILFRVAIFLLGLSLVATAYMFGFSKTGLFGAVNMPETIHYTYLIGGALLATLSTVNPFDSNYRFGALLFVFGGIIIGSGAQMDITPVILVAAMFAIILFAVPSTKIKRSNER